VNIGGLQDSRGLRGLRRRWWWLRFLRWNAPLLGAGLPCVGDALRVLRRTAGEEVVVDLAGDVAPQAPSRTLIPRHIDLDGPPVDRPVGRTECCFGLPEFCIHGSSLDPVTVRGELEKVAVVLGVFEWRREFVLRAGRRQR